MKKLALLCLVMVLGAVTSFAQLKKVENPTSKNDKVKAEMANLSKRLNLTPDQVATLKPITEKRFKEMKTIHDSKTEKNEAEVKMKLKSKVKQWAQEVNANLDDKQKVEFQKYLMEKKSQFENGEI